MSKHEHEPACSGDDHEVDPDKGPSLTLLYGLLVLALAAAIGFALLIVLPFYHRR
ncbi:MAG: hypothetical protein ACLQGT_09225 [Terracidiphilus sp.]